MELLDKMKKRPEVAILLATYNGEKYLPEQLDSLLRQKLVEQADESGFQCLRYKIYIHDDGSSDGTAEIIHSYAEKYPEKIEIIEGAPTGGAKNNFFYLMRKIGLDNEREHSDFEGESVGVPRYFFFCDQDDVWLEDKLQRELNVLRKLEKSGDEEKIIPLLVWCDMKVVDENLDVISPSFSKYSNLEPDDLNLDRCIMHGKAAGCSIACNDVLIKMCCEIVDNSNAIMHDWVLFLIAKIVGCMEYIDMPLALYRQHSDNKIGAQNEGKAHIVRSVLNRLLSMKQLKATQDNLKRYISQVACLKQVREVYQRQSKLIDGACAFDTMKRIDKVRFVNEFKLYRHKRSGIWTSIAAFLIC